MTQRNDNTGRFSKNDRKEKPNHPDIKGSATINGVEYWISGWNKKNENGPWCSLAFESKAEAAKRQGKPAPSAERGPQSSSRELNDEIPW